MDNPWSNVVPVGVFFSWREFIPMRAIGYFKVKESRDEEIVHFNTLFEEFCRTNLHQPVATFEIESSEDGTDFAEFLKYLKKTGPELFVVVGSAEDLGSNLEEVTRSLVLLDRLGTEVGCLDEERPNILQNALYVLGSEGVSPDRGRRIKDAMSRRALEGYALGRPPYGYRIGSDRKLIIDRKEEEVVRLIFSLYTESNLGLRLIVRDLNQRGLTTRNGGSWNIVSIRDILRNPTYIGTYTRIGMRRPNAHQAIISADMFRTAQALAKARTPFGRVTRSEPFLLSGIIYCAYCDNKMMGVTRRRSWKRKDGNSASRAYRYYQCQSRNNQGRCGYHTWREEKLEEVVVSTLSARIANEKVNLNLRNLRAYGLETVKNSERLLLEATRRAAHGEITINVLGQYIDELDSVRKEFDASSNKDESSIQSPWSELQFDERRLLIQQIVSKIVVLDDHIEIEN